MPTIENLEKVILQSSRLLLKPVSLDYKEDIFREFTAEITTFMRPEPAIDLAETESVVKDMIRQRQEGTDLVMTILKLKTLEFMGMCGIHRIDTCTPELGIWLKKSARGHRFGREAIALLKDWAIENLKWEYLSYPVDRKNIPSRKIPESMEGKIFQEYQIIKKSGNSLDLIEYRIYPPK